MMHLIEMLIERDYKLDQTAQLQQSWFSQVEEMAQCLRIHRQIYGIKHAPSQFADSVQAALRVLVHHLEYSSETEKAFMEICRFGVALGQKFKSTAEAIQDIQYLAGQDTVTLPRQALAILDGSE